MSPTAGTTRCRYRPPPSPASVSALLGNDGALTTLLGIHGAVVVTAGICLQAAGWLVDRRKDLKSSADYLTRVPAITVTIVNRSAHEVRVTVVHLTWEAENRSGGQVLIHDAAGLDDRAALETVRALPDRIAPRDAATVTVAGKALEAALPADARRLCVVVETADRKTFVAGARRLD